MLRRSRRKGLVKAALDFSPTTVHFVNHDDGGESGGGSFSRSSDSGSSEARGRRPSVGSASAPVPAPAPIPLSAPSAREIQGVGTGFAGARYAYGSAPSYYDSVRQQPRPQPQPQQQPQPQVRWQQQQDEWPLPPDFPSSDTVRHPSALIPAHHRDLTAFNVPFAAAKTTTTVTTAAKPLRFSGDGGLPAGPRVSRTSQVPLPPPAPRFPNTLSRVDEMSEDASTVRSEDRRNRPRVLKVRRRFRFVLLEVCSWLTGVWHGRLSTGDGFLSVTAARLRVLLLMTPLMHISAILPRVLGMRSPLLMTLMTRYSCTVL